jgi:hypothetical protein
MIGYEEGLKAIKANEKLKEVILAQKNKDRPADV